MKKANHCPAREYHMTKEVDAQCLNINIVIAFEDTAPVKASMFYQPLNQ